MNPDEQVLTLPAALFKASPYVQSEHQFLTLAASTAPGAFMVRRGDCETDTTLRQVIPYVMLRRTACGQTSYLVYERAGGEGRLHGKLSVGVGGHVNTVDDAQTVFGALLKAARRELVEECGDAFEVDFIMAPKGLIVLDGTEVDRVHVGVLFVVDVPPTVLLDATSELRDARWVGPETLRRMIPNMESWSQSATSFIVGAAITGYQQLAADAFVLGNLDGETLQAYIHAADENTVTISLDGSSPVFKRMRDAYVDADAT